MINLLAPGTKHDIALAKQNFKILKLSIFLFIALIGMILIILGGLFYMDQSKKAVIEQNQEIQQTIDNQNLGEVQKQADEISGNIKLTTDVLSEQILFSKLIRQIGSAMPANTSLNGLSIGKADGGVNLTARASSYSTASQIQVNLSDPSNQIFDKADIININCDNAAAEQYPCTVSLRARFNNVNNFLFITPEKKP